MAKLEKSAASSKSAEQTRLELSGRIKVPGLLRGSRAASVLRLSNLGNLGPPNLAGPMQGRRAPYARSHRSRDTIDFSLSLPPDLAPSELPSPTALERPSGRYALSWSVEGHSLKAHRELTWTKRITPTAEFEQLLHLIADAEKADSRGVVLRAAAPHPQLEENR